MLSKGRKRITITWTDDGWDVKVYDDLDNPLTFRDMKHVLRALKVAHRLHQRGQLMQIKAKPEPNQPEEKEMSNGG